MVESHGSRVAVAGASIVLGAGAMVAERAIGLDVAFAGTTISNERFVPTQHNLEASLSATPVTLGYINGQLFPKHVRRETFSSGVSSNSGEKAMKKWTNTCPERLIVTPGAQSKRFYHDSKKGVGSLDVVKKSKTVKATATLKYNPKRFERCGLIGTTPGGVNPDGTLYYGTKKIIRPFAKNKYNVSKFYTVFAYLKKIK